MTQKIPERPEIATLAIGDDLRRWYWLKEELVHEAPRGASA